MRHLFLLATSAFAAGCGGNSLNSEAEAELLYIGLDSAIEKAMGLGFEGYNESDNANISQQQTPGDVSGTLIIDGQIDQGSSDNKGMRLNLAMVQYSDFLDLDADDERDISVTYWTDTDAGLPTFDLQLRGIPDGTFDGSLAGSLNVEGDIAGEATLSVSIDGGIESDGDGGIRRTVGSTAIVGSATSPSGGVYYIDISL